jgi:formylglycine-generating enzyme required for sulfatase activity
MRCWTVTILVALVGCGAEDAPGRPGEAPLEPGLDRLADGGSDMPSVCVGTARWDRTCDGRDDDCDGRLDEDVPPTFDARTGAEWVCVPGGHFLMGGADVEAAQPVHGVAVPSFWLARTEVTVAQFEAYAAETGRPLEWDEACNGAWSDRGAYPVNCVSRADARAFAAWAGARLPSEAEWEFAARGGAWQRTWPWGHEAPTCHVAIVGADDQVVRPCAPGAAPVCSTSPEGDSRHGVCDLAGNVAEWVDDAWHASYAAAPADASAWTAESPRGGVARDGVARGGHFDADGAPGQSAARVACAVEAHIAQMGFRLARTAAAPDAPPPPFPSRALDEDEDGVPDVEDNCPAHHNPAQLDTDGGGDGDACDADDDDDTVPDAEDCAPLSPVTCTLPMPPEEPELPWL